MLIVLVEAHRKLLRPVVKTCSTTVSPGMMAAKGGAKLTRLGAVLLANSRCFSTRGGLNNK